MPHLCGMTAIKFPFLEEALNLPSGDFQINQDGERLTIYDPLRKKFLILTPEEWVRQHIVGYLVTYKKYPKSLFAMERGVKYNQLSKRFDILVLDREGRPFLLIECKAPEVKLSQKTVEQVCVYNKTVGAPHIAISNGKLHICLTYDAQKDRYNQVREFPEFVNN